MEGEVNSTPKVLLAELSQLYQQMEDYKKSHQPSEALIKLNVRIQEILRSLLNKVNQK